SLRISKVGRLTPSSTLPQLRIPRIRRVGPTVQLREVALAELRDVFGLNRYANPLSYVVRPIENQFISCLTDNSVVVIVVYGMSKQGKTSAAARAAREQAHLFPG